jgi:hypothetical protein
MKVSEVVPKCKTCGNRAPPQMSRFSAYAI